MIDYAKYEKMDKRKLFNALLSAEKKYETMKEQISNQGQLVTFLQAKVKNKIDDFDIPNEKTVEAMKLSSQGNNGKYYNSYSDFEKEIDQELKNEA